MSKPTAKTNSGRLRVPGVDPIAVLGKSNAPVNKSERVVVEGFRLGRLPPSDRNVFAKLLHKQRARAKKALEVKTF
jgi:hypothetical protein